MSAESAMATLEDSLPYRDWIVGVGLDSDEKGNPPVKFKEVFARRHSPTAEHSAHAIGTPYAPTTLPRSKLFTR